MVYECDIVIFTATLEQLFNAKIHHTVQNQEFMIHSLLAITSQSYICSLQLYH